MARGFVESMPSPPAAHHNGSGDRNGHVPSQRSDLNVIVNGSGVQSSQNRNGGHVTAVNHRQNNNVNHMRSGSAPAPATQTSIARANRPLPPLPSESTANGSRLSYHNWLPSRRTAPSLEETRAAAQVLFTQFCREKLPTDTPLNLDYDDQEIPDEIRREFRNNARNMDGYGSPYMSSFGRDLRRIAEAFENSPERAAVRCKADQVDIRKIGYNNFRQMLMELFLDGEISRERIMVLFFFCSDLAVRAISLESFTAVSHVFTWSLAFLFESICSWVQRQGGWGVVLGSYVPKVAVTVFCALGAVALAVYLKKSLRV